MAALDKCSTWTCRETDDTQYIIHNRSCFMVICIWVNWCVLGLRCPKSLDQYLKSTDAFEILIIWYQLLILLIIYDPWIRPIRISSAHFQSLSIMTSLGNHHWWQELKYLSHDKENKWHILWLQSTVRSTEISMVWLAFKPNTLTCS